MLQPLSPGLAPYVNKSAPLRFLGADLAFCLSHGLFSSFDIDDGTRLLLKSIAQRIDFGSLGSALDVGCGVGVIGACIAAAAPAASVTMQDRDALAVAVARENCRLNGLPHAAVECRLAFHGLAGAPYDLVTSNLPAKAGSPVLTAMLRHAAGCLASGGIAAVVIVAPLAGLAREAIAAMGAELRYQEDSSAYSVFHYSAGSMPGESKAEREDLAPYIRGHRRFQAQGFDYSLDTAFSLPDFDTLGHDLGLCFQLLERRAPGLSTNEAVAFWNPGQGHLPVALAGRLGPGAAVVLAGRDCLECRISGRNLAAAGVGVSAEHLRYSEGDLGRTLPEGAFDLLVAVPHPVPRSPWQADLARCALRVLKPGGELLVSATSTEMHRFLQAASGLTSVDGKKKEGFRAALMRRSGA